LTKASKVTISVTSGLAELLGVLSLLSAVVTVVKLEGVVSIEPEVELVDVEFTVAMPGVVGVSLVPLDVEFVEAVLTVEIPGVVVGSLVVSE